VGVTQAVNDMLVQAPGGRYIALFPMWPRGEPASFASLRAKGGFLVSATWDNLKFSVANQVIIVATAPDCTECVLLHPWPNDTISPLVTCDGQSRQLTHRDGRLAWPMKHEERCTVESGVGLQYRSGT